MVTNSQQSIREVRLLTLSTLALEYLTDARSSAKEGFLYENPDRQSSFSRNENEEVNAIYRHRLGPEIKNCFSSLADEGAGNAAAARGINTQQTINFSYRFFTSPYVTFSEFHARIIRNHRIMPFMRPRAVL